MIKHETITLNEEEVKQLLGIQDYSFSADFDHLHPNYSGRRPENGRNTRLNWARMHENPRRTIAPNELGDMLYDRLNREGHLDGFKRSSLIIKCSHQWAPTGDEDYPHESSYHAEFVFRKQIRKEI